VQAHIFLSVFLMRNHISRRPRTTENTTKEDCAM
jgi:hypothetical protein